MATKVVVLRKGVDGKVSREVMTLEGAKAAKVAAQAGQQLSVQIESPAKAGGKGAVKAKQVGKSLVLELDGKEVLEISDYFAHQGVVLESVSLVDGAGQAWASMPGDAVVSGAVDSSVAGGSKGVGLTGTGVEGLGDGLAGATSQLMAVGAGGVALLAVAGGGGGGAAAVAAAATATATATATAAAAAAAAAAPAVSNMLSGLVMLGPVVAGNGLWVHAYDASGKWLGKGKVDDSGRYQIDLGSYVGPAVVMLQDAGGGVDYNDEAAGRALDLAAQLSAVSVVSAGANVLNINPVTTLAARRAGVSAAAPGNFEASQSLTLSDVQVANDAIKAAFGLGVSITGTDPDAANDGGTTMNYLGALLAAFSGLDGLNGGDMNATFIQIDRLIAGGGGAPLMEKLIEGGFTAEKGGNLTGVVRVLSDALRPLSASGYVFDAVAADGIIDAAEVAAGLTLTGKLPTGTTGAVTLKFGGAAAAGTVTVNADGSWTYAVQAGDVTTLGLDGSKTIELLVDNVGKTSRVVYLNQVDDAPTGVRLLPAVTSVTESTDVSAGLKVADIVVTDVDGGTNALVVTGADAALFEIKNVTELWLKAGTALDHETLASLNVQVTATGGTPSGMVSSAAYALTVTNVNEAPTALGSIAAQTAVLNQSFTPLDLTSFFADVDAGDTRSYAITAGTLPAGLTLNAATGVISGTPTANAASANYTVTMTDSGGLTASQTFALQVVSAPVVQSISVADASGDTALGKSGDAVTFTVTFTEPVTSTGTMTAVFTVNGQDVTATAAAVSNSATVAFTGSLPAMGDGTAISLKSLVADNGGIITGNTSGQPMVAPTAGAITFAGYTVDSTAPTIGTLTINAAENGTAVGTLSSDDAAATFSTTLGGADAALFSITSAGVLTFNAAKDFEAPDDAGADKVYNIDVTVTDAAGNTRTQAVAVNLTNVNEAPTVVNTIADQTFVVGGAADSFTLPTNIFSDVDAGTTLTFSATLSDGGALPSWLTFDAATGAFSGNPTAAGTTTVKVTASDGSLSASDEFTITAVAAPNLSTTLGGVTNLDVRSKIVLSVGETVTANTGGTITLTDLGGAGFRGEATTNTQTIDVTDTARVQIVGTGANTKIIIDPEFDFDLTSNYSLAVSTGAFHGVTSTQESVAFTTVNFSTVTPGVGFAAAAQAQTMDTATGAMVSSLKWFDASNIGNPSSPGDPATFFSFGTGDFAAVLKSLDPANAVAQGQGDMRFNSFGANDLVYLDHQNNADTGVQAAWAGNLFAGGNGSAGDPYSMAIAGDGQLGAYGILIEIAAGITLPPGSSYADVISNNWSNTGMVIAA